MPSENKLQEMTFSSCDISANTGLICIWFAFLHSQYEALQTLSCSEVNRLAAILKNNCHWLLNKTKMKSKISQLILIRFAFGLPCCIASMKLFKLCPYSLSL